MTQGDEIHLDRFTLVVDSGCIYPRPFHSIFSRGFKVWLSQEMPCGKQRAAAVLVIVVVHRVWMVAREKNNEGG